MGGGREGVRALVIVSYAKQKHLGYTKVLDQSEAAMQTGRCD